MNQLSRWSGASIAFITIFVVTSCAGSGTYTPPQPASAPNQYEATVSKSFDDTWTAIIDYASQTYFAIDHFEKASGLLTLSFGSADPAKFIDCGQWKAPDLRAGSMPYATYLRDVYGAKLDGKMNLVVRSAGSGRTVVRVNARYIFSMPGNPSLNLVQRNWVFDSGGESSLGVSGDSEENVASARTCRPTYAAERAVLQAVAK